MTKRSMWVLGLVFLGVVGGTSTSYPRASIRDASGARSAQSQAAASKTVKNAGVGTYTDSSVANQISNFTINRSMVSCGVGTLAADGWSGPFAMLMYATNIKSYRVDPRTSTIRATGTMRSITQIAGVTMEDVQHQFLAVAVDSSTSAPDSFDVHFTTPFWNTTSNPMCTKSTLVNGGCRFGGKLLLGEIAVGR